MKSGMCKNYIIYIVSALLLSAANYFAQDSKNEFQEYYENNFFEIDFSDSINDLSVFKKYFFTTFPHDDPTLGDVVYDRSNWLNDSMLVAIENEGLLAFIKDRKDEYGYDSFRLTTKAYYNLNEETDRILFVFKGSFPSVKGLWPAWWLNGSYEDYWTYADTSKLINDDYLDKLSGIGEYYDTPSFVNSTDWPSGGEIDIIENINGKNIIHNTLHTCPQSCESEWNDDGIIINCANSNEKDPNPGCSGKKYTIDSKEGTFACLWTRDSIKFYYWEPGVNVREAGGPLDLKPAPELWDEKYLKNKVKLYETSENCEDHNHTAWQCENCEGYDECRFANLKMIFNTTVCGVWAGNEFDESDNSFDNCNNFILSNEGKKGIHNKYLKIEYVAVKKI
jgi:hypothetical protein